MDRERKRIRGSHPQLCSKPEQTKEFAARLASSLAKRSILALYGPLGSGKTTFVQGLVLGLNGAEEQVQSPTFVYLNIYDATVPIFHFDLYRLNSPEEFLKMGFDEYFEQDGILAIEWPERIEPLLPPQTIRIRFSSPSPTKRLLDVQSP